ncbi:MAG TPA: hypothetical protein PLT63_06030, partial [Syntrophales bacterium]|nr:hypothetical protein [Syntrophales bacterium]
GPPGDHPQFHQVVRSEGRTEICPDEVSKLRGVVFIIDFIFSVNVVWVKAGMEGEHRHRRLTSRNNRANEVSGINQS